MRIKTIQDKQINQKQSLDRWSGLCVLIRFLLLQDSEDVETTEVHEEGNNGDDHDGKDDVCPHEDAVLAIELVVSHCREFLCG